MPGDGRSRDGGERLRLFVAAEVPDGVRTAVASAAAPVRERHPGARWVPTPNQHVTLKFLGATPSDVLDRVTAAIGEVGGAAAPVRTGVVRLGAFPSARRARVLWAGLDDAGGGLGRLAGALDAALAWAVDPERRPFTPHLTLARFDPPVRLDALLGDGVDGSPAAGSPPFEIERIVLSRSRLRRPAPIYEPVATFPLGG